MTGNGSTTLRRYRLRGARGQWLAEVVISDDGYFSTVSDYGNYAFYWSHAGDCFRRFLTQLEPDYVCSKLGCRGAFYDGDATEEAIKRRICHLRRQGDLSQREARREWATLAENSVDSREGFAFWWRETRLEDASELSEWTWEPQLRGFAEEVLPVLQETLRAELAAEAKGAA